MPKTMREQWHEANPDWKRKHGKKMEPMMAFGDEHADHETLPWEPDEDEDDDLYKPEPKRRHKWEEL
jgi:hypothetical protein